MKTINQIFIDGKFVTPHGSEVMELINPSNQKIIGTVRLGDRQDIDTAVAAAKKAFETYSKSTIEERVDIFMRINKALADRYDDLMEATILEYGAPKSLVKWFIDWSIQGFALASKMMPQYIFEQSLGKAKLRYEPIGVVAAIIPWNADYISMVGKIIPALSAGCTIVIKPSEMSAIQTQIFAECLEAASIPPGIINIVNGTGETVGDALTKHPDIMKIAFTGSTKVGKMIYSNAAETLKRVSLELGGKSATIIFDDADFIQAIPMALQFCFFNSGQACVAGSRLLVPTKRLEEVKLLVKESMGNFATGDPRKDDVIIGPMVSKKQYERVQYYINKGIEEGAELIAGGLGHPKGLELGNFVKPTVFTNVTPNMTIAREEIFGPVLSIITYDTEEQAISIANDTVYGLFAYIITPDMDKASKVAAKLEAGSIGINQFDFEPLAPFGGFKQSGIGRESSGFIGVMEYLEMKTILS